ncbi:hypothetical protein EEL30_09115 [Brevibacillus laterosporus]|uniref:Uncharacterized protein n=1 Tax=Brevibacillus laterosporus TaxID=1465 RepID=A0A518V661_BRELA|nr:hypothetical protein EEL30_09115 [Brevibacillus laterosporus]
MTEIESRITEKHLKISKDILTCFKNISLVECFSFCLYKNQKIRKEDRKIKNKNINDEVSKNIIENKKKGQNTTEIGSMKNVTKAMKYMFVLINFLRFRSRR